MSSSVPVPAAGSGRILHELTDRCWSVVPHFVEPELVDRLRLEALAQREEGRFRHARVGIGAGRELRPEIRGDHICWLDPAELSDAQRDYWQRIETLRGSLNEAFGLGLFEFEAHLAIYPAGAFYRRHLDRFRGAWHRVVTCILYLNRAWSAADGGALRIYPGGEAAVETIDVPPEGGTLVVFRSAELFHEVMPARRERIAITGWLRHRA